MIFDISLDKIKRAQTLKTKNLPRFLFKYRQPNDNALKNLKGDSVWLDKPTLYNDPFEFAEFINFKRVTDSLTTAEYEPLFVSTSRDYGLSLEAIDKARRASDPISELTRQVLTAEGRNEVEIREFLDSMVSMMDNRYIKMMSEKVAAMQDQMKASSFSESHEALLMWSHYADHHRGICIQYDLSKWRPTDLRRKSIYPVRYVSEIYDATQHLINSMIRKEFNNFYPLISGASKSKE